MMHIICHAKSNETFDVQPLRWNLDYVDKEQSCEWRLAMVLPCNKYLKQDTVITQHWRVACQEDDRKDSDEADGPETSKLPYMSSVLLLEQWAKEQERKREEKETATSSINTRV